MNLYFDNASTSYPKPDPVPHAVMDCMVKMQGNPGRTVASYGARLVYDTREALARFFNIPDSIRVVFTNNATTGINLAVQGLLKPGDRVITTSMEHNAVGRPLRRLEKTRGIDLTILRCSPEGFLDPDDLKRAMDERSTRMVIVNHASNVVGTCQDLKAISQIVKSHDSIYFVDTSQSAGIIPIDVRELMIDVMACPGHKSLYGPTGTGICYLHPDIDPEPLMFGGTGSLSEVDCQPDMLPDKYESGTLNFHGLAGLNAGVKYLMDMGWEAITRRENEVKKRMLDGLAAIDGLTLYGPKSVDSRVPVFSINCPGRDPSDLGNILEGEYGIATRVGLHCAPWAHETIGSGAVGTVRLSPGLFNTPDDIDFVIDAVHHAVKILSQ